VTFEPSDDIVIESAVGADLPLVIVKTKGGKTVTKGVVPTLTIAPEGVVSLDAGKLTPLKNGTATLTASVPELPPASVEVKVSIVENVRLACPMPCVVGVGNRVLINAQVEGLGGNVDHVLEWKSSRPEVATVEAATVTGVASGTATITATAGGKASSLDVIVLPALDELRLYCPNPAFVIVEKKGAPPAETQPPQCLITQGGSAKLLLQGAKGAEVFTPPVTWQSSSTSSLLIIDGEINARDVGFASVSAIVGDLKAEMPIQVVSGNVERCSDPIGYGFEANTLLASGTQFDFMCASPSAAQCVKDAVPGVDNAQAPAELMPTLAMHAMQEHARRCCCKPK
jgi:hypothetical protein